MADDLTPQERQIIHKGAVARDTEARQALNKVARSLEQNRLGLRQRADTMLSRLNAKHERRLSKEAQAAAETAAFREISDFEAAELGAPGHGTAEVAEQHAEAAPAAPRFI